MTKNEFIKKYCNPSNMSDCKQITWDLCSDIEETFNGDIVDLQTAIGAAHYDIDVLLEVMRKELPDYAYLQEVSRTLDTVVE